MTYKFQSLLTTETYGRQATIASHVFHALRDAIITLKLVPGNRLSEAEIAKQMDVSRQPVREAFIQLSKIGLLNIIPQKGTYVVKISEKDVENARFIREAIEVAVVRRAGEIANQTHVNRLLDLIAQQEKAADAHDHTGFLKLDDEFHQTIALSADCLYAWQIVENLKAQMDRVRFLSLPDATPIKKIVQQHHRIARAIAEADPRAACTEMRRHLSELQVSLPKLAEEYKDMFTKDSSIIS